MKPKVVVPYDFDDDSIAQVELSVGSDDDFQPALRDTVNGRKVVWVRSDKTGEVWLRDASGARKVLPARTDRQVKL
jgi:hypothetical protein